MDSQEHIERFNLAVSTHDWDAFVSRFHHDARLEFVGPPVGPFVGRAAIAEAYRANPPDDRITMSGEPAHEGDELVVPFRWATSGETGTMRISEADGFVTRLVVTFD